jgi:hypothetical protein
MYRVFEKSVYSGFEYNNAKILTLGKTAGQSYVATHWLNQPVPPLHSDAAPNARIKRLDDGVIRIIGIGWKTCPWCGKAVAEMRHWVLPAGVEREYISFTEGVWGNKPVEPAEEAEHLINYFVKVKRVNYPVAIWAGPLDTLFDGGVTPRPAPWWKAMLGNEGPLFVVTDGHGIVRFRFPGYSTYAPYKRIIDILVAERARQGAGPVPARLENGTGAGMSSMGASHADLRTEASLSQETGGDARTEQDRMSPRMSPTPRS